MKPGRFFQEEGIYQRALATAIEQAANSQLAVKEHLRRLAFMKAERAWKECIGNEYESKELGTVKAVAVGFKTKDDIFKLERYNNTENAISVFVVSVGSGNWNDVESISFRNATI